MRFAVRLICLLAAVAALPAQAYEILQPLPERVYVPAHNPQTPDKIALGAQLFFDARLSYDGRVRCNDCHDLSAGGESKGRTPAARPRLERDPPTLWNVAVQTVYFWDGRAPSLEGALREHLLDGRIMAFPDEAAVARRLATLPGYPERFQAVFGEAPDAQRATQALAAFIRTLLTPDSPFDRYVRGDEGAISAQAKRGLKVFDDLGCLSCHFGPNFAGPAPGPAIGPGEGFYELFPNHPGTEYDARYGIALDPGRERVTGDPGHRRMWRVPTLRNIALTAPYFHNGSVDTLEEAIRVMAKTQLRAELDEGTVADIAAFLRTLTGRRPQLPLPQLPVEAGRVEPLSR